jgi:hypothetical protein
MAKKKKQNGFQKKQQKEARKKLGIASMKIFKGEKLTDLEILLISNRDGFETLAAFEKMRDYHERNAQKLIENLAIHKYGSIAPCVLISGIDDRKFTYVEAAPSLTMGEDVEGRMRNYHMMGQMAHHAKILPLYICSIYEVWASAEEHVHSSQDSEREEKIMISSLSLLNESFVSLADINRDADGNILPPNFKNDYHDFTDNLSYNFFNGWKESSMKGNVFENQIKH